MSRLLCAFCLIASLPIAANATPPVPELLIEGSGVISDSPIIINQISRNSILNWAEFNIGQSATVNFNQGQSSKATLNSVLGTNQTPSGVLTVNSGGSIYLVNPNGVTVQPNITPLTPGGSIVIASVSGGLTTTGNNFYISPTVLSAVPEPSTYLMVLLGLALITYRRQFKH
jgi:filamentous hemagglutinin family protein